MKLVDSFKGTTVICSTPRRKSSENLVKGINVISIKIDRYAFRLLFFFDFKYFSQISWDKKIQRISFKILILQF